MNLQFPDILRPLWGKAIWRKSSSEKVIYLTFDDGPVPEVTPLVLDILDKFECKATFFCVGENVFKNPKTYSEILQKGHKTGNHTYNHLKGFEVTKQQYIENTESAAKLIESNLFRPPYGRISFPQKKELQKDYEIIMWDLLTHDYNKSKSPDTILKNIQRYSRNGSIVVFHDSIKAKENVLNSLPLALAWWKQEGYEFGLL